jgi:hypothetical protein
MKSPEVREAVLDTNRSEGERVALALVYIGDRISELESPSERSAEQLAAEVGGAGRALSQIAEALGDLEATVAKQE